MRRQLSLTVPETGCGPETEALFADVSPLCFAADKPGEDTVVRIDLTAPEGKSAAQSVYLSVAEGCAMTAVMTYHGGAESALAVQTKLTLGTGAKLRLIQTQLMDSSAQLLNDIGGLCGRNAAVELVQAFPGTAKTYAGCALALSGDGSSAKLDLGYLASGTQVIDMNYVLRHTGKKTTCEINASGALRDAARKIFRGAIDFKHGSAGSAGDEKETVLLLGDDVVNQTVPLILCAEEDVAGNHGATIGRLDEDTLLYFASRGIPEAEAADLLSRAIMESLAQKMGDEQAAEALRSFVTGGEEA